MIFSTLSLNEIKPLSRMTGKVNIVENALGDWWQVPIMIAKGKPGPTLGITAALHGNELNGIFTIQNFWKTLDPDQITGTVVLIPVLNAPGFLNGEREFYDGKDLNRLMPGDANGTSSEVYANALITKVIPHFDYLIDLHTASFGRINSLYVKASLKNDIIKQLAILQNPQIIVDKKGPKGSLRRAAEALGIPTITVEIGDPYIFQKKYMKPSIAGLNNVLIELNMITGQKKINNEKPIMCQDSNWIYAKTPGILTVYPGLTDKVEQKEHIADITDIYGDVIDSIFAPYDGYVIGKSTNPVCEVGSRIIHIGISFEARNDPNDTN